MTRSELISRLYEKFPHLTKADAELCVAQILNAITDKLAKGGRVEIRGLWTFSINIRRPRIGRNPKTGEKVAVPAKPAVHFKPGVELREMVNRKIESPIQH